MISFESFGVSKATLNLLEKHSIVTPTPIQKLALPHIFQGKDVIAQAETGSGKTLAFALPLIDPGPHEGARDPDFAGVRQVLTR
jgi:ATP-dependent RNA helicase DeaD